RLLRTSLHVGLIDLYDIGTGGEKVLDLLVDGDSVVHGRFGRAGIEVVLGLLAHGERAGHRHFHLPISVALEEFQVADLDRPHAAYRPDDPRHWIGVSGPVERRSRIDDVYSLEGSREPIGIAFTPYLSIGDDIETGLLLRPDRQDCCVVLG